MAQIKVLKISSEGVPSEHSSADDLSMNSMTAALAGGFTVTSGVAITNNITFNAVTDTIAGIQNQNLLDKTAAETITGDYDFNGEVDVAGGEFTFPSAQSAVPADGDSYWDGDTLYAYDGTNAVWLAIGGSGGSTSNLDKIWTAGEALTATDAVYISANDTVKKAKADSPTTDKIIGFAVNDIADTADGFIRQAGIITGVIAGATAGDRYYLSKDTAGDIVSSPPTGAGNRVIQVGFAKNATDLDILIQFMGTRS